MTQTQNQEAKPPSAWVGERLKDQRRMSGYRSQAALAERVTELGLPMERNVLANLESGRRGAISVEESFALAAALNCSPTNLILPPSGREAPAAWVAVTPKLIEEATWVRAWIYGDHPIPLDANVDEFMRSAPEHERRMWRAQQHPAVRALYTLVAFVRDAVNPERTEVFEWSGLAGALRQQADRVTRHIELLADELERRED